jgi:Domain of unknown function (DUF4440)
MNAWMVVMMLAVARPQGTDSAALVKLEDDWARALVRRDTVVFQRLLAPGFVYSENDQTMSRDDVLRGVVSGPDTVEAAANEDMKVHRFGTTALVTGWLVVRGRGPSGAFERRYRFTDTWMKRGTRWQIVGAHDYLAPKP